MQEPQLPSRPGLPPAIAASTISKRAVAAWGLWDWGSAAYNAVVVTFVFGPYLVDGVAKGLPGTILPDTWLGISTAIAGLAIALLAPVTGQRADSGGHRKRSLGIWTALIVIVMLSLFGIKQDYHYFALGLILMGVGSVFSEFAGVSYNAMLHQVSTPKTIGRISGFGWSMGYVGGIFLLLICYLGFIAPTVGWFGASDTDGLRYRLVAVFAAIWFVVFALPVMFAVPEVAATTATSRRVGFFASYQLLWSDLRELFRTDRHSVFFLMSSAIYRDGLAAVFSFGAILAVTVYGIAKADVLIFGVAANLVAAIGAFSMGFLEDRIGPKPIILISLTGLIVTATILLFSHGPAAFWVFGLILCLWVGPAQSSSRAFLARLAPAGREGQMFGLYATTGRAVSFLAPALFALFSGIFHSARVGIVGIALVLLLGAVSLWRVRPPQPPAAADQVEGEVGAH